MTVEHLYVKPRPRAPMIPRSAVRALTGLGLEGDCNASAASPRQVLIVSRGSLDELRLGEADLRANVVVDLEVDALSSGTVIRIGDALIRLTIPCEPCYKLEPIRRGLAKESRGRRGVLGRVLQGGEVRIGDPVSIEPLVLPPLEDRWQSRVADIVGALPAGMQLTFARLAELAGVQSTYCRAFRPLLRRLAELDLPIDRVVTGVARGASNLWDGASYFVASERVGSRR